MHGQSETWLEEMHNAVFDAAEAAAITAQQQVSEPWTNCLAAHVVGPIFLPCHQHASGHEAADLELERLPIGLQQNIANYVSLRKDAGP